MSLTSPLMSQVFYSCDVSFQFSSLFHCAFSLQIMRHSNRVCELLIPHKDIFKKHVVGLMLRYIRALNEGMNPTTKSKLLPSIYALLDMCSDFETRQINAMIDTPSKALFAPIFQSYRKYYQYHG